MQVIVDINNTAELPKRELNIKDNIIGNQQLQVYRSQNQEIRNR